MRALVAIVLIFARVNSEALPPFALKCERNSVGLTPEGLLNVHSRNLFATDNPRPRLSWSVQHGGRNVFQDAFQVRVAADADFREIVWDTATVRSELQHVVYGGDALKSGTVYYWKVRWWDSYGSSAESEETGCFLTGVMDPVDWTNAKWIKQPTSVTRAPAFFSQFKLAGKTVSKAAMFVSGLGYFRASVNGVDINSRASPPIFLVPGWTNYEMKVPYHSFDIKDIVGTNISSLSVSVQLGMGWRDSIYTYRDPAPPRPDSDARVLRGIITLAYADGSTDSFYTDEQWDCANTAIVSDSVYNGETYDAQGIDGLGDKALISGGPNGEMYLPSIPPISEMNSYAPVKIYQHDGNQIVDFGFNSAGVCRLNISGLGEGTTVSLHHTEVPMHEPYGTADGSLYYANLRSAKQLDTFTARNAYKSTTYQPTFTYHGFQYVEVSGYPRTLTNGDIEKVEVHTALGMNSKFNSSILILRNIQENVVRGQLSNLMSVPTDCDQRDERLGWMGDAGLSADSMALNFHMDAFFSYRVQQMADEVMNGTLPDVVPFYRGGGRPGDPSWEAAFIQTVWVLYKVYGDLDTARTHFPAVMDNIDFMLSRIQQSGIGSLFGSYGDWVPPPHQPKVKISFTSAFNVLTNVKQAQEMAMALHDQQNATKLGTTFAQLADSFNKAFLANGKYEGDLQISYVLPLALGIVPSDQKDALVKYFINKLTTSDNTHVTAGIIGTKYLLPVLTAVNRHDLAMEIVQQVDYPSWGFMIHNPLEPATTIWELWNSHNGSAGMNSRNHHMFSSVSGWLQTDMIGFAQPQNGSGYKEIELHPARSMEPSAASISLEHPRLIDYSWHRKGGIQCGKVPEDRSSLSPNLPKHGGLRLSCGDGFIREVTFASYGNPKGTCGYHQEGSCHAPNSKPVVEELCVNKTECIVPSGADFWGELCPRQTKWLTVSVHCRFLARAHYKYSSLEVNASIPVGSFANLFIPAHGKRSLSVWEGGSLVYSDQHLRALKSAEGVLSAEWMASRDRLRMRLASGSYHFVVQGEMPKEIKCVKGSHLSGNVTLGCSKGDTINSIDWVSYGNPVTTGGDCYRHFLGSCHSGVSKMAVEMACLGQARCTVPVRDEFFGGHPCPHITTDEARSLVVKYTCNDRKQ